MKPRVRHILWPGAAESRDEADERPLRGGSDRLNVAGRGRFITAGGLVFVCADAWAQSVTYGRVAAVQLVTTQSANARVAGTLVG